jgi:hypothetical protein
MHICDGMKLTEIYASDGVSDLPPKVKSKFAQALKLEAAGNHDKANECLDVALANEAALAAAEADKS